MRKQKKIISMRENHFHKILFLLKSNLSIIRHKSLGIMSAASTPTPIPKERRAALKSSLSVPIHPTKKMIPVTTMETLKIPRPDSASPLLNLFSTIVTPLHKNHPSKNNDHTDSASPGLGRIKSGKIKKSLKEFPPTEYDKNTAIDAIVI